MRLLVALVISLVACRRDRVERPIPPPVVHVRQLPPVIGERFVYRVDQKLELVLGEGDATLAAREQTTAEAEEIVTAVASGVCVERSIRFLAFTHQPLGAPTPLADVVTGKTYRWTGTPPPQISEVERQALLAYVRDDTGAPDLAAYLLTDRDFERGVTHSIPADQPAPLSRGVHAGATITLTDTDGSVARFAITQVRLLQIRDQAVRMTLTGTIVMNIGTARVESIAVEGHITQPEGPVREAHMTSLQTFTYLR